MAPGDRRGPVRGRRPGAQPAHGRRLRGAPCPVAHGASGASAEFFVLCPQPGQPRGRPERGGAPRSRRLQRPSHGRGQSRWSRGPASRWPASSWSSWPADGAPISAVKAGHVSHAAAAPEPRGDRSASLAGAARQHRQPQPTPDRLDHADGPGPGGLRAHCRPGDQRLGLADHQVERTAPLGAGCRPRLGRRHLVRGPHRGGGPAARRDVRRRGRRPAPPAAARPGRPHRRVRRGRDALVPHAVRP